MRILFTGGGSGGHAFPIIAIVREIKKLHFQEKLKFFYLGPKDRWAEVLLSKENIKVKTIWAGKIRRYFGVISAFQNFFDFFFKIPIGISQAIFHLFFFAPDLIFSKGGFGAIPTVIAGWFLRIPIFLHESDSIPGMANQLLAKFSLEIFVSFPETSHIPKRKMILVGNPIRTELLENSKEKAKEYFKLSGQKPVILILGGSQGAQRINDKILSILPELLKNFELIHQSGERNFKEVKSAAEIIVAKDLQKYYHPFPFLEEKELKTAYAACDLIISRAGGGSIFEMAALGKPSILIPLLGAAQDHQVKNAYIYANTGAALVLEEQNFTPHFLLEKLKYLFSHPEDLAKMALAAKGFAKPQAAKIIAKYIVEYLTR